MRPVGPLLRELDETDAGSPLSRMTVDERISADFGGTGLTIGKHPIGYRREELRKMGVKCAVDLAGMRDGCWVKVAGWVIVRQRPGTAKGFMFMSLEDETGVANAIVTPDMFDKNRSVLTKHPFLLIEGVLQSKDAVSVKVRRVRPLSFTVSAAAPHDFH